MPLLRASACFRPALLACAAVGLLRAGAAASAQTNLDDPGSFPTPAVVNAAWNLELLHKMPRTLSVEDAYGKVRWYWYLPYTVVNDSGEDQLFIPEVTVVTDGGRIIEAGQGVPANVYPAIASRIRNGLLESPQEIIGTLRQGVDFAKDSVAIWPVPDEDVDEFTVFFAGISGETQPLLSPSTGQPIMEPAIDPLTGETVTDSDGNPVLRKVLARRTTVLRYSTPGTPPSPQNQPIALIEETQVMR